MAIVITAICLSVSSTVADEPNNNPIREIFVPFDDLNLLLQGDAERTFLTRDEYEDLIAKAKQTPIEHAPHQLLMLSADYDTVIEEARASIRGKLWLEVLEPGLHAIPLDLNGVGIRTAMLDGKPASLGRNPTGQVILFVEGVGQRLLELDLVTILQTSAAQQSLQFALPTPTATKLHVAVPGNVEVRSGAAVVSRTVDEEANVTRFELLPQRGPLSLVMSLNNKLLLEQRVVMARSVIVDEMTQAFERLHATVSLGVLHGAVDQFQFRVPAGFEITDVKSPMLARWLVDEADGKRTLEVDLREPTTGTVVLNISAINNAVELQDWQMPRLEPLDVANHVAVVGLLIEERLTADSIATTDLIPIDNAVLRKVLPESVFQVDPGAPKVRPVAAFYAPQDQFQLTARFMRPPAQVDARTTLLLTIGEKEQRVQGTITLVPSHEKVFSVDIDVPDGWRVSSIKGEDGSPLSFERISDVAENLTRLRVKLSAGVAPGAATKLTIDAASVPNGWLDEWSDNTAHYPVFVLNGVATTTGAVAVQTRDDLIARPDDLVGLTTLGDAERESLGLGDAAGMLVYRIDDAAYSASFAIERVQPRVTARAFNFLKIEPEGLTAHYEIVYDVRLSRTRKLIFRLPEATPASLSVTGLDGATVKEHSGEVVDGQREWTASLAAATIGQVRLAIDFQQPLAEDTPKDWELPLVRAMNVAYQSAIVAVEGSSEFDAQIESNGRVIDVGELVDANYQVGNRLLGAFGFVSDPLVTIDVFQRDGYGLPAAITERAELVTLVAASGNSQTSARYLLRTKAAFLQISLPADATLWSASVDGKPSTPQRDGDDLVISLPPTTTHTLRDLQIVYETAADSIGWLSDVEATAPRLVVRMDNAQERYNVPTADVLWHLVLPEGHRMVRSHGSVFTVDTPDRLEPVSLIGGVLYRLGGGIGNFGMMSVSRAPSAMIDAAYSTDESVMSVSDAEEAGLEVDYNFSRVRRDDAEATAATAVPQEAMQESAPADTPAQPMSRVAGELAAQEAEELAVPLVKNEAAEGKYWALQGVRSLQIELERSGPHVTFQSMGVEPQLRATLIQTTRWSFLSWVLALITATWGITRTSRCVRTKTRFVLNACVLAIATPLVIGLFSNLELSAMFVPMLYAAMLLVPYYLIAGAVKWIAEKTTSRSTRAAVATTTAILLAVVCTSPALSQEANGAPAIDAETLAILLQPDKPVQLPADAVIIPYNADDVDGVENAEKVLVPYAEYVRLWNLAFPNKPLHVKLPPAPYALSDAKYTTTLEGEEYLLIRGQMDLNVYAQSPVEIPLRLEGGVLERATLDGEPARLRIISADDPSPNQPPAQAQMQQAAPAIQAPARAFTTLYVDAPGRKRLELLIRLRIDRSGGWRIAAGQLPAAPATQLTLAVPAPQTELRLTGTLDRASFETKQADESISTALPLDGSFRVQWRPAIAAGQVDQTLTARSLGVLDVQEDGVRLAWQLELQTRNNQRETFTFVVPQDYLVERVSGDNVRGWQSRPNGNEQQIDVTLLKAATGTETIRLRLSRRSVIGIDGASELVAPVVAVPDAVLHQGQLAIRRSPLLDVRTEQAAGMSRVELAPEAIASAFGNELEESPLGLKSFEAYRFGASTYQLQLSARAYASRMAVEERTVLRIDERQAIVETRLGFTISDRATHQLEIILPDGFELKEVVAPGSFDWAVTTVDDQQLLTVYLAEGALGTFNVDLRGSFPREPGDSVTNPAFIIQDAATQSGYIVVQVDPAVDVSADQAENVEEVPLARVASWLADAQRAVSRLVMFHRTATYKVNFRVTPRNPKVNSFSVTNVRVTPREIEELVFIKFQVRDAGIREVSFLLPTSLRDSQITVPRLRQKTIESVEGDASQVRVRLELQDQVIDDLIILVENSRSLTSEDYSAPIPTIETGTTDFRYVVLESAGRDEVVVTNSDGFLELNRQLSQWKQLAQLLQGNITHAYVARDDAEAVRLSIATRQRAAVETAGASIGLARTLLVVDANGAYRGTQEYRVDNKTEQFLEIELPEATELWTAVVAGEAVKPTVVPNDKTGRLVRIPLIKTQTGDPDYAVILKYGGDLKRLRTLHTINFPLIRTVKINVELSQVRLRLPESQRWFNFAGSMRHVTDDAELEADRISYKTRQLQRLMEVINGDAYDPFSKVRAENSAKLYVQESSRASHDLSGEVFNERLQRELISNYGVVQEAEKQLQQNAQAQPQSPRFGNSSRYRELYEEQASNRASGVVSGLDNNFDVAPQALSKPAADGEQQFNEKWFDGNKLSQAKDDKQAASSSRIAASSGKAPAAKPSLSLDAEFFKKQKEQKKSEDKRFGESDRDEVSQIERYQQRLETQNGRRRLDRYAQSGPQSAEDSKQSREYLDGIADAGVQPQRGYAQGMGDTGGGGGFGGGGFGGAGAMAGADGPGLVPQFAAGLPKAAGESGLTSLDVDLPERGVEYLFTTPRGDIEIAAQSVAADQVDRALGLLAILGVLIALAFIYRIGRAILARISDRAIAVMLILLGLISVVGGILPVVGVVMIVVGVVMIIRRATQATHASPG